MKNIAETKLSPIEIGGANYVRELIKTDRIDPDQNLLALLEKYLRPHLQAGDIIFVSEKVVAVTQGRIIAFKDIHTGRLAKFLSKRVRNNYGTKDFHGFGHGTAMAMQLLIEEAGMPRVLFAAAVSAVSRPLGIKGAFYFLVGKLAKSVDCPMSFTIMPYNMYAKRAPLRPKKVAEEIKQKFGVEAVVLDANYRGAFSLGKSSGAPSEKMIGLIAKDNPAGQSDEMLPFFLFRSN